MRKSPRQKKAERRIIRQLNQSCVNEQLLKAMFKRKLNIGELVRLGRCWLECGYEAGFEDGLAGQAIYSYK